MRKRNAGYEFIRDISMLLVLATHSFSTVSPNYPKESLGGMILSTVVLWCNGLFFMISGKFALSACCRTGADYRKYYLKRLGSIGIPVLLGMLLRSMYNVGGWWPEYFLSADFLKEYIQNVLYRFSSCEYWFLYELVGFLLAAPFLGKFFQQASKGELLWFIGICYLWNSLDIILPGIGLETAWKFPFSGWLVLFVLGYAVERIAETEKEENCWMICGAVSFVITILLKYMGMESGLNGWAPTYGITVGAVFLGLKRLYRPGKILDAVVIKIGSLTLPVYLLHMIVLYSILPYIPQWPFLIRGTVLLFATAGLTLILAWVLDRTVLSGLQWLYRKLTGLQ